MDKDFDDRYVYIDNVSRVQPCNSLVFRNNKRNGTILGYGPRSNGPIGNFYLKWSMELEYLFVEIVMLFSFFKEKCWYIGHFIYYKCYAELLRYSGHETSLCPLCCLSIKNNLSFPYFQHLSANSRFALLNTSWKKY